MSTPVFAQWGSSSPFPDNIIIRNSGIYLEGTGKILDLRQGLSATYDSISGVYHITGTSADSIAALATLSPSAGDLMVVTDGNSATDCTTGSGSTYNLCVYNGSAWVILGDGAGGGTGDLLADASVPMTSDWDIGNFDITLKALTGDGTIEGATITEGGNAVYSLNEAPTHTVAGNALDIQNTTDATPNQVAIFKSGNRATPANNDAGYICLSADNDLGTQVEFVRMTWLALDVVNDTKDGALRFDVMRDDSLIELLYLSTNSFVINKDGHDVNFNLDNNLLFGDAGLNTLTVGSNTSLGKFGIDGDADQIQLMVQGVAGQTADLIVVENSNGVDVVNISASGNITSTGTVVGGHFTTIGEVQTGSLVATGTATVDSIEAAGGTYTGTHDFSSATDLSPPGTMITSRSEVTPATKDSLIISDNSDSDNPKKIDVYEIIKKDRCAIIENLVAADDNLSLGSAGYTRTIESGWCHYVGTGTLVAQISFETGSGVALTHDVLVCTPHGTTPSSIFMTANNTLAPNELLVFDVDNTPDPVTDDYTICFREYR